MNLEKIIAPLFFEAAKHIKRFLFEPEYRRYCLVATRYVFAPRYRKTIMRVGSWRI